MKRRVLKFFKVVGIVYLSIVSLLLTVLIVSIPAWIATKDETYLDGIQYESIEQLHAELVEKNFADSDDDLDCWVKGLVTYFEIGDLTAIVSVFSERREGKLNEKKMDVQFAKKEGDFYSLITPVYGYDQYARFSLDGDLNKAKNEKYYATIKLNQVKQSICFLYKDIGEEKNIYFDDNITSEVRTTNPFDGREFYICYGTSNADAFWDFFKPRSERHTIELR